MGGKSFRAAVGHPLPGPLGSAAYRHTRQRRAAGRSGGNGGVAGKPLTVCRVILDWFRATYRPLYRTGNSIRSGDGRDVLMTEACTVANSRLIAEMAKADDAPRLRTGEVNFQALPSMFKTWARVAWGDLLQSLPDEDGAEDGNTEAAREQFRQAVREAMLSEHTLSQTLKTGPAKTESAHRTRLAR